MTAIAPPAADTGLPHAYPVSDRENKRAAGMHALFQRMRTQCERDGVNALVFFDQGHPEYRRLYRMAQVFLPTGSRLGGWFGRPTKNMPLDMFVKDGNEKNSSFCYFTQAADLIAYAAFMKMKGEDETLTDWQAEYRLDSIYNAIPKEKINVFVSDTRDGIKRL